MFASLLLLAPLPGRAASETVDVAQVVQRSVDANRTDWAAFPQFSYNEEDWQPNGSSKTYRVSMILGSPYNRLIAVDGEPLSRAAAQREQARLKAAVARRRAESPGQHAARIAEYEKERKRDRLFLDQLTAAFDFTLVDQVKRNGRDTYVLKAVPKPGYQPPVFEAQVLKGMRGTLWIDAQTYQWVKVQAKVVRPVYIVGFLARVDPGTSFELEYAPVEDGVWLPTHFLMHSHAKVLLLLTRHKSANQFYSDYQQTGAAPKTEAESAGRRGPSAVR